MMAEEELTALFTDCLEPDYKTPQTAVYTAYVYNTDSETGVPGCTVTFCTGDTCIPVKTDESGAAVFEGAPADYDVKLVSVPDGMSILHFDELNFDVYTRTGSFYVKGGGR